MAVTTVRGTAAGVRAVLPWCSPLGAALALVLAATCLVPKRFTTFGDVSVAGIADGTPELSTYGIAVSGLGVWALWRRGLRDVPWQLPALTVFLLLGLAFAWPRDLQTAAGVLQYLLAVVALPAGAVVGATLVSDRRLPRTLALCVAGVFALQVAVAAAQRLGVPVFELRPLTTALMGSRVNGTLDHPNTLGKVVVLLLVVTVPLTRCTDRTTRRLAAGGILLGLLLLGLSGGRANLLGALSFLVLWALTLPRESARGRAWLLAGSAVACLAFAGPVVQRFRQDPTGGSRGVLNAAALDYLPRHPVLGVGPNRYVTEVGKVDPLTGRGLPVHNSLLLAAVEIGVVGATLLFSVYLVAVLRRLRAVQGAGVGADFARALVTSSPAVLLIALTGWGMLANAILPLWFLVVGICVGASPLASSWWRWLTDR